MTIAAQCTAILATGVKPTVPQVLPIVQAYYSKEGNICGGSLHIVLDDGNTETHSVEFCEQLAREHGDEDGVELARVLLRMSRTQRERLYRM